jgi:NAD-dependent deacetylase
VFDQPSPRDLSLAAALIAEAQRPVALTGAGMSTPSGIPDFRSPGSGLWERVEPMAVASLTAFRHRPEEFYEWVRPLAAAIINARPNRGHHALARLEHAGRLAGVITQNIDGLHIKAGSRVVHEIHGHLRSATCGQCFQSVDGEAVMRRHAAGKAVPRCPDCGGLLKPNVVLFGEQLPYDVMRRAEDLIESGDLIIVAGSSLEVSPAALLPVKALNLGARLVMINHQPTYLDVRSTLIFRQDVALVLSMLVDEVLGES